MSLLFQARSHQRVTIPRDAAIDDAPEWSVLADVYPTTLSVPTRCDIFKKSHAKRIGTDDGPDLYVKQNYSPGLIEYAGTFFDTANIWYCACVAVSTSANRAWIYKGKFSDALAEIAYDILSSGNAGATLETDVMDPQYGHPGNVILGNEAGRFNFERGYPGRIARVRWWTAALTLAEFRLEYQSPWALRRTDLAGDYHLGWDGNEVVIDRSGHGRHGVVVGA